MILNSGLDLLRDFAVQLAFPLRVVVLCPLFSSSLRVLPLLQFEVVQPKLVLEQVSVLRLNYP